MTITIKEVEINTLTIKLKSTNDLQDNFVIIKSEIDNQSIVIFKDEIDSIIKTLQDFKQSIDN